MNSRRLLGGGGPPGPEQSGGAAPVKTRTWGGEAGTPARLGKFLGRWLAGVVLTALLPALEVPLQAPASTVIPVLGPVPTGGVIVSATVTLPADIPTDLGIGAWAGDRHGSWAGRPVGRLTPGTHRVRIDLGAEAPAQGPTGWGPSQAAQTARAGLFLWSAQPSAAMIRIDDLRVEAAPAAPAAPLRIVDLSWPATAVTGQRWQATFRIDPEPTNPFDPDVLRAELIVTRPDGVVERRPAFWDQPMADRDRGDIEEVVPVGPGHFAVRWRPRIPGVHRLRLEAVAPGQRVAADLPSVTATGPAWDGYARVDAKDRRFLQVEGRFWWPVGINLRSIHDERSVENLGTRPVANRGARAYGAYLDRFGAAGVDAAEVWLAAWSLALEWNPVWAGYGNPGRYHLGHAWQLDQVLDRAEANGQRLVLVLNNHGQGSSDTDREWASHPYNRANGGFLAQAYQLFTDAKAARLQAQHRRYLIGRYGDSPAILAWKLWSEVDLTEAGRNGNWAEIAAWHAAASADLAAIDTYAHPITTHFSGTWRRVQAPVVASPNLTMLTIDAYHGGADEAGGISLADLLATSSGPRALARYNKPILVTEHGGNSHGAPLPLLSADHAMGMWVALVSGHAGSPMLWWCQWVDQGDRFGPYRAIRAFIAGEDLRGAEASSATLRGEPEDLWVRAWVRPGRMLGYVQGRRYAADGSDQSFTTARVRLGEVVSPGGVAVQWWNADTGVAGPVATFDHPGGPLVLEIPPFQRHCAFKVWRTASQP